MLGRVIVRDMRRAMVQIGDRIARSVKSVDSSLIDDEKHRLPRHAIFHKSTVTAYHENQSLNHGAIVCIGDLIRCSQICKYFHGKSIYACRNDPYG